MILLIAVILGLIAGWARARRGGRSYEAVHLRLEWLVFLAFIPQLLAFHLPGTSQQFPDRWVPVVLVGTQALLLVFAWVNRKQPGFWALGLGLFLNFTIIALNNGWMPISTETVQQLAPHAPAGLFQVGQRLGSSKDLILASGSIHLGFLADRFTLPQWFPYRVAFSLGDIFISVGAFWILWSLGGITICTQEVEHDKYITV